MFAWLISHDWKYCWLICCERKILFVGWKVRLISQANKTHLGQSVGKLSSQHLSSSSDVRFACPDHHSAWHAFGSHLATMQEETCQSAQPKESLVIPRSLASPLGLNHFHKSQATAIAGPSQPPSPQFHAIEANYAWSSIRAPPTNGWKKEPC